MAPLESYKKNKIKDQVGKFDQGEIISVTNGLNG